VKDSPSKKSTENIDRVFVPTENPKKRKKTFFVLLITALVLVGIYIVGIYMARAVIMVTERSIPFSLENTVIELPHETNSDTERLSFQTMTVTTEINREVFGSELKEVTGKSKGSVVFFNEYSKNKETIKSGTRLNGSNGKQYLTQQSITVPGYTLDSKNKKVPGTSESVAIIAVDVGSSYNSDGLSFNVTNFSGSKRSQIYARSLGKITGGESGMRHTVSDAEKPAILESLKTQLNERLRRETRAQIPEHLITYPDLQFISIDPDSLKLEGEGVKFTAKIKGSLTSYLIPIKLLESAIAKSALSDQSYSNVSITNLASLKVIPESAIPTNTKTLPDSISISISGEGNIITKTPTQSLKESLIGAPRSSFDSKIAVFKEISSARFKMFPFWSPFFPKEERYIRVDIK
ncbi:hypothetical protein IT402_00060, partial [Candidatus Nomurabacteria bacterium]|nr:hypothetical protein [Candidatus Nomurabacteria bacterium]